MPVLVSGSVKGRPGNSRGHGGRRSSGSLLPRGNAGTTVLSLSNPSGWRDQMTAFIGRREFITLLGGAAAWPLAARAQQAERMRRVGVLMNIAADDADAPVRVAAFAQGLQEQGWTIGRNLRIDYRWTAGEADRIRRYAAEIAAFSPDVIIASGGAHAAAVQRAAPTVPVVFLSVNDPVAAGLVASLARPGGNATGFTALEFGTSAKWLELLKQIAPGVTRVAVLRPAIIGGVGQLGAI